MRIVIADDEALLREGLARLLADAGFEIAGRCGDADALMRMVEARRPQVALVDIRMPPNRRDDGLVAAQEIRRRHPDIGVLLLSHYLDSRFAMRLLEEVPERVGYLLKERVSDVGALTDALRRLDEGDASSTPRSSRACSRASADAAASTPSASASATCLRSSPRATPTARSPSDSSCRARPSRRTSRRSS